MLDVMILIFCMVVSISYYKMVETTLKNDVASYGTTQDKATVGGSFEKDVKTNTKTTDDLVLMLLINDRRQPTTKTIEVNGTKMTFSDKYYENKDAYITTIWNNVLQPLDGREITDVSFKYNQGGECWWQYSIN